MMTKKKILIGSIFAALLMVSVPFASALQTTQVAASTTTTSVQPSNPTATITAVDIANINSINSLVNDLKTSLSKNPGTVTPEQMIKMIQLTKLSRTVLNDLGYTDGAITQLSIKALNDKGYTIDAASFNQKLQAVLNLNPESISSGSMGNWSSIQRLLLGGVLFVAGLICAVIASVFDRIPILNLIMLPIDLALVALAVVLLSLAFDIWFPTPTGYTLCADTAGSKTPMTSN